MRTAAICPTCAVYYNALCVLYNGDYLSVLGIDPLDSLEVALEKINAAFTSPEGTTDPTAVPLFIGQLYLNTATDELWIGLSTTIPNWGLVGVISTTTTTTTSSTTTIP
jgi:hypothetical protein